MNGLNSATAYACQLPCEHTERRRHLGTDKQTIAGTSFGRSRNISLGLLCVYCGVLCMNSVCLFWRVL